MKLLRRKYCECGCGKVVNKGRRFIRYHYKSFWNKGLTKETDIRVKRCAEGISRANKGLLPWNTGLTKFTDERLKIMGEKVSKHNKGIIPWSTGLTKYTDDRLRIIGEKVSKARKGHIAWNRGLTKENNESLKIISDKNRNYKHTEEAVEKIKLAWQRPDYVAKHRETMKTHWKDPKFVKKQIEARDMRPNKPELFILGVLNEVYPNEWKYTGDFSFMIGGKNPDFANVNGQKKLIEHFGIYYHRGEDPQERINHFKKWGFDTLVVWENELKNKNRLKVRFINFHEKGIDSSLMRR